jgi:hypothetical protein
MFICGASPATVNVMYLMIRNYGHYGTKDLIQDAWFDDLKLEEVNAVRTSI